MDYLGWELERQRRALRALLLGTAADREEKDDSEGERRLPEGPETAGKSAAGRAGESSGRGDAAGPGDEEAREAVRKASRDRRGEENGAFIALEDAWERALEAGARDLEREAAGGPLSLRAPAGEETIPRKERPAAPKEETWTEGAERTEESAGALRLRGRSSQGTGGGGTAGFNAAVMRPGETGSVWVLGENRRSGPWGEAASAALRAEDEAAALSRAVQRDARRYDGGFTIY